MPNWRAIFGRAIAVCWGVVAFCWLASMFTPDSFAIVVDNQRIIAASEFIEGNIGALFLFSFVSSSLSMVPFWLACLRRRWFECSRDVILCVLTVFFATAVKIFDPIAGAAIDLFLLGIGFPCLLGARFWRCLGLLAVVFCYQALIVFARGGVIEPSAGVSRLPLFLMNIDYVIFAYLLYLYSTSKNEGGEQNEHLFFSDFRNPKRAIAGNVKKLRAQVGKSKERYAAWRDFRRNRSNRRGNSKARSRILLELAVRTYGSYAIVFGAMLLVSFFGFRILEALLLFVAYLALRWTFPTTFHTTPAACTAISVVVFSLLIANSAPLSVSLTSCVLVSLALGWALWRAADYKDLLEGADGRERMLRDKCKAAGFSSMMSDFAVDYKLHGLTIKEQMSKTGLGQSTVKNYRSKVNKVLK